MTDLLEQVVFGWSETGLQGRNRLQLVASSEGWRRDNKYRRAALRLCRLDAPGGRDPISFGWVDLGGRRFVFQRRMVASSTGDARRLVAHVVAGAPGELSVDLVLRAFDSDFWWAGDALDPVLEPASATDLLRGSAWAHPPAASPVAEPLLGRILAASRGTPVAFEGDSRELHAAAWGIHERLPRLFETLSFSTYETGQMVRWFDVVGLDGTTRPRGAQWCSRNATSPRYDDRQLSGLREVLGVAAKDLAVSRDAEGPKVYRDVLRAAERAVAGKPEAIPKLLTRERTLPLLLSTDVGVRAVAQALWVLDPQPWPRVPVADAAAGDRVAALARAAADAASPDADVALGVVARRLRTINPRTGPAFVERVLERRAEGDRLAAPDQDFLAAAASWVFATPVPESIVVALSTWLERNVSGPLLLDRRLPEPWRHTLFVSASADGTLDREDYADLAVRHPALFESPRWLPAEPERVLDLLAGPEPLCDLAAEATVRTRRPSDVVRLATVLHGRDESDGVVALLDALGRRQDVALEERDSEAVWRILSELALRASTDATIVSLLDLPWGVASRLRPTQEWIDAAAQVLGHSRGHDVGRSRVWVDVLERASASARASLCQLALHDLALTSPADWAFRRALAQLPVSTLPSPLQARVMLSALDRREEVDEPFLPILLFGLRAAVVSTGFLRLRVTAGDCEDLARRQVARLNEADPGVLAQVRRDLPRPVVRWLRLGRAAG